MEDLVDDKIRIRDLLPNNIRSLKRIIMTLEMGLQCVEEAVAIGLLMLGIRFVFLRVEEGSDEEGPPCIIMSRSTPKKVQSSSDSH